MATPDVLLALLVPAPSHGYDLKRAHDEWFADGKPLAYGQVYSTLARLQRDGLVDVAQTEAGAGPERVVYEITSAGRERVQAWLAEPVEPDPPGSTELVKRAVAAVRLGLDPAGFFARQREVLLRRLHALSSAVPTDLLNALVHDHAVAHLDAELRWLDDAAARLTVPTSMPATPPTAANTTEQGSPL